MTTTAVAAAVAMNVDGSVITKATVKLQSAAGKTAEAAVEAVTATRIHGEDHVTAMMTMIVVEGGAARMTTAEAVAAMEMEEAGSAIMKDTAKRQNADGKAVVAVVAEAATEVLTVAEAEAHVVIAMVADGLAILKVTVKLLSADGKVVVVAAAAAAAIVMMTAEAAATDALAGAMTMMITTGAEEVATADMVGGLVTAADTLKPLRADGRTVNLKNNLSQQKEEPCFSFCFFISFT
jgi:hypothetical protein